MKVNNNKLRRNDKFNQIRAGDVVFDDCESGPCSGGARYGIGEVVEKVSKTKIYTSNSTYYIDSGREIERPVYVIQFWQKG